MIHKTGDTANHLPPTSAGGIVRLMRAFAVLLGLLTGCRSECLDYATVVCGRYAACIEPIGREECTDETMVQLQANRTTEDQCRVAREGIAKMTCADFRAFWASLSR